MPKKPRQPFKSAAAVPPGSFSSQRRWLRNGELASYLGISKMTLWRFKHDASFNFPPAAAVNGIEFNDLAKIDKWMEAREQRA